VTNYGDWAIVFAILASVSGALVLLFLQLRWRQHRDIGLVRAAERLGGTVAPTEGLELPTLRFVVEGRPAVIEYQWGELHLTWVKVSLARRSPGVCRILRQNLAPATAKFRGVLDVRIGDTKFDREWTISARPESFVGRIFLEERREQVMASVRRIERFAAPSIEITRDTLIVRVNGLMRREDDLMDLAQTAIDFVGYVFRLGPEEGISWVASTDGDPGLCPVCATALAEGVIFCDKCKTPQHEECWVYVGQCSTYACKGKRFVE
jgi:hypothetical protein